MENSSNTTIINDFDDMELRSTLLRGIYGFGFEKPSLIQRQAIVPIISDTRDMIAQAQSGSGKTAAFAIGTLQLVDEENNNCQTLILSPTRELAEQTYNVIEKISTNMEIKTVLLVGGQPIYNDMEKLRNKNHFVIGTPGRVTDMIKRGSFNTEHIKNLVIDEADEMLSRGFKEQIKEIFQQIPENTRTLLFSATIPPEILELTNIFMKNPIKILVKKEEITLEGIKQFYINVRREEWKYETLCDLYESVRIYQSIIYCNKRKSVIELTERLTHDNFTVASIHSKMPQSDRNKIMRNFRDGHSRLLISTDLLSRGIDVQGVSLVINYDIPYNRESYIHRIGRSGRYGRKGIGINFTTDRDLELLKKIESYYETQIEELPTDFAKYLGS